MNLRENNLNILLAFIASHIVRTDVTCFTHGRACFIIFSTHRKLASKLIKIENKWIGEIEGVVGRIPHLQLSEASFRA